MLSYYTARAVGDAFGPSPEAAADAFVCWGWSSVAWHLCRDVAPWAAYVADAIVPPAIGHDIFSLAQVRRPALLRQLFALAADAPAQTDALQQPQARNQDRGILDTLVSDHDLLRHAHTVATLERSAQSLMRGRMAPPRLVPLNDAMMAVLQWRNLPYLSRREPARFGR